MLKGRGNKNTGTISIQKYKNQQDEIKTQMNEKANFITKGNSSSGSATNYVDLDLFENVMKKISEYSTYKIEDLSPDIKNLIDEQGRIISICKRIQIYETMIKIIKKYFTNETVEPGTVEAFFHGCMISSKFPGNPSCSAVCAGNVPPPHQTPGWERCKENVFLMINGKLDTRLLIKSSSHAIVHVTEGDYIGFTKENIELFRDLKITHVSVNIISDDDYIEHGVKIPIEKLNIVKESEKKIYTNKRKNDMESGSESSSFDETMSESEIEYTVSTPNKKNKEISKKSSSCEKSTSKSSSNWDSSTSKWKSEYSSDNCRKDEGYGYFAVVIFVVIFLIIIIGAACYYCSGNSIVESTNCAKEVTIVEDQNMISLGEMSGGPGWISTTV